MFQQVVAAAAANPKLAMGLSAVAGACALKAKQYIFPNGILPAVGNLAARFGSQQPQAVQAAPAPAPQPAAPQPNA